MLKKTTQKVEKKQLFISLSKQTCLLQDFKNVLLGGFQDTFRNFKRYKFQTPKNSVFRKNAKETVI